MPKGSVLWSKAVYELLGVCLPSLQPSLLKIFLQDGQCVRQYAGSPRTDTRNEGDCMDVT